MRLSIVTVCYRNLEGLRKTCRSLQAQTWRDFEWIVIDGGSLDGTSEFLEGLSPAPAYWVSEPDGGIYEAMNKGLGHVRGEYVLFLNSGDALSDADALSRFMEPAPTADVVYGDVNFVSAGQKYKASYSPVLNQELLIREGVPHPAAAIKTEVLKAEGGYDVTYRIVADFKFWLQIFKKGKSFEHRPRLVSDFLLGGVSSTDVVCALSERQRAIGEVFGVSAVGNDYDASCVVVVVPVYKQNPSAAEELSLRRSFSILRNYEISLCCPEGLDVSVYDALAGRVLRKERFLPEFFQGLDGYNRLMVAPDFYLRFSSFEYLLICQPDVWIFRDELCQWCKKGYDYVGAPIFGQCYSHEMGEFFWSTGNGGLSLRNVRKFIDITTTGIPARTMKEYGWSEDCVFCIALKDSSCALRLPLSIEAAHFSFERSPKYLFELTGYQLPFGCHAWAKYDFYEFWSRYIPYELTQQEIDAAVNVKNIELGVIDEKLRFLEPDSGDSGKFGSQESVPVNPQCRMLWVALKWLRGQSKQFVPYGLMCLWLRLYYGKRIDKPLSCYGYGLKLLRRMMKFVLPYGLIMEWRGKAYGEKADVV